MKTRFFLLTILSVSVFVSCGKDNNAAPGEFVIPDSAPVLTKAQLDLSNAVEDFGLEVFSRLYQPNKDIAFSPMSLSLALTMCELGAEGETARQIAKVQGLEGATQEQVAAYYQAVIGRLLTADENVKLASANAIWADQTFPIKKSYEDNMATYLNAEAFSVDFSDAADVRQRVNKWGADHTWNKIPDTIPEGMELKGPVLLANALYFNAPWGVEFDKELVTEPFYGTSGTKDAQFFTKTAPFSYAQGEGVQLLSIPYSNGIYDFVVILPDEGKTLDQALVSLKSAQGKKLLSSIGKNGVSYGTTVSVKMPCFEINYFSKEQIKNSLIDMGAPIIFTDLADFSGLSSKNLTIDNILQKAFLSVNEKGSEAAAVTVVVMDTTDLDNDPGPIAFTANRPFLFMIRETGSNAILFIGAKQ